MSTIFTNFTSPFVQLDGNNEGNGYLISVEGSPVGTNLNFTPGENISILYNSNTGEFEISAIADSLSVQDEGNPVSSGAALINFVGPGVTASEPVEGVVEVSIPGSSAAVDSVNSLTGDVVLDTDDLDDSSSANKFITQSQLDKLSNIEAEAQVNPSLSELNSLGIDAGTVNGYTVETSVPFGAVFTDTTYTVGDGGLTEFNFNAARREIVDLLSPNNSPQAGETLVYNGTNFVNNFLSYSNLSGTPNLSPVATSGDYSDLSNTPSVPSSSDDLTQGTNNLFYSDALVKNYLQAGSGVSLSDFGQNLEISVSFPVSSVNGETGDVVLSPDDLDDSVSSNKFVSQLELNKLDIILPQNTTPSQGEALVFNGNNYVNRKLDYSEITNTPALPTPFSGNYQDLSNKPSIPSSTDDLSEGDNLFFTEDRSFSVLGSALIPGSNISISSDSSNNKVTISSVIPVESVNGKTGDVVLNPDDLDDSSSTNKFIPQLQLDKLSNIEAGAQVNPSLSELNSLGIDAGTVNGYTVETSVPTGAVFTDTTYTIGDGGLTQFNFNAARRDIVDLFSPSNPQAGETLLFNGTNFVNGYLPYSSLTGTPNLSPVATSGDYSDLSNTPSIPSSSDDLTQGTNNLFYSDALVQNYLQAGSGVSFSYSGQKLEISVSLPVNSVNGETGDVVLNPDDLDDSASSNKFITNSQLDKLSNIEAGAQVNPSLSELNSLSIDAGTVNGYSVETSVPTGAVFTDTTYTIGDGGLTQFNFNAARRYIVDLFSPSNPQAGETLLFNGSFFVNQTLDSSVLSDSNSLLKSSQVVDNLSSLATKKPLSANQGRILKQTIDSLGEIIVTPDQTSRDNLTGLSSGDIIHVVDRGDGTWQRWQIISVTDGSWATSEKVAFISQDSLGISLLVSNDSDNIVSVGSDSGIYLSASDIKTAYESLPDTNPFTDNNQATVQSLVSLSPDAQPSQVGQTLVFDGSNFVNRELDYSEIANTPVLPTPFSGDYQDLSNKPSIPSDTDDLNEGSNLFFTDDRSFSVLESALISGSNINLSVDSLNNEITLSAVVPVSSVNGETGDVVLNPDDFDDSSSTNKFISQPLLDKLSNIESGAQVNPSLSELNSLGIDAGTVNGYTVETSVPSGAVFTDTTYTIGDGGLTEFNFNAARRNIVDLFSPSNPQDGQTFVFNGTNFVNRKLDYSEITNTPDLSSNFSGNYEDLSNKPFIPSDTDDLDEGNNLFFTDDRSFSVLGNALIPGSNINLSVDSLNREITLSALVPVSSVNGETGDVVLNPDDLDDSTSSNKFITQSQLNKLSNIEAGAQVNPSLSELNSLGIDAGTVNGYTVETSVPFGAVFTDTTYTIGDGGLTEFNFNAARRNIVDLLSPNNSPNFNQTLVYNGTNFVNGYLPYSSLTGTPNLSPVATSGDYSDLSNAPSVPSSSDDLTQGTNNLFYSDALVKNYLQAGSGVSLSDSGQNLEISVSFPVNSVNGETGDVVLDPDDLDDSTSFNKFVSQPDLNKLNLLLPQNTTPSQGEALVFNGNNYVNRKLDYSEITNTPDLSSTFSGNYQDLSNKPSIPSSTDDLMEGDNKFITFERTFDYLNSALLSGDNISFNSDGSSFIEIDANVPVDSVNGRTGDVVLNPDDLDDTNSLHKFVSAQDKAKLDALSDQAVEDLAAIAGVEPIADVQFDKIREGIFSSPHSFPTGIDFSRNSSATRWNAKGILETVPTDYPRIDYNPKTRQNLGLLIEPSSTNLLFPSDTYPWTLQNVSVFSVQNGAAPDGGDSTLYQVQNLSNHKLSTNVGVSPSSTCFFSFFIRPQEFDTVTVVAGDTTTDFDLNSKTIINSDSSFAYIKELKDGWYRIGAQLTADSDTDISISFENSNVTPSVPNLEVWGVQLEESNFPTSYIPTQSGSVTREADLVSIPSLASNINQFGVRSTFRPSFAGGVNDLLTMPASKDLQLYISGSTLVLFLDGNNKSFFGVQSGLEQATAFSFDKGSFRLAFEGGVSTTASGSNFDFSDLEIGPQWGHLSRFTFFPSAINNLDKLSLV